MSPRTTIFFPLVLIRPSVFIAESTESGLALYVSFRIVTPAARTTSIRFPTPAKFPSARPIRAPETPNDTPTADAASAFAAACKPGVVSPTVNEPRCRGSTINAAHPSVPTRSRFPRIRPPEKPYDTFLLSFRACDTTRGSSALTNPMPEDFIASNNSPSARPTPRRSRKNSRCSRPMFVISPCVGSRMPHRYASSPKWLVPISTTAMSCPRCSRKSVFGTPI